VGEGDGEGDPKLLLPTSPSPVKGEGIPGRNASETRGISPVRKPPLLAAGMKAIPFSVNAEFKAPCEPSR